VSALLWWVLAFAGALVVVAIVLWAIIVRRGHQLGTRGIVQRSRLTCPKCHRSFDYDWIPGASFTAVRLGTGRYMACPLCRKWSYFDVYHTLVARPPGGTSDAPPGSPPIP
jgi:hypothetical protein